MIAYRRLFFQSVTLMIQWHWSISRGFNLKKKEKMVKEKTANMCIVLFLKRGETQQILSRIK